MIWHVLIYEFYSLSYFDRSIPNTMQNIKYAIVLLCFNCHLLYFWWVFSMKTKENVFTKYEVDFQLSFFFQRDWEVLVHNFEGFFAVVAVVFFWKSYTPVSTSFLDEIRSSSNGLLITLSKCTSNVFFGENNYLLFTNTGYFNKTTYC